MENNNHKKHKNISTVILIVMSFLFIMIGGCGLDSESIVMPIVFIVIGLVCGMVAMVSDDEI